MAEAKAVPTAMSVDAFIAAVEPASKREDAKVLDAIFRRVTGEQPRMWGPTIIGYGDYRTTYESGRDVHNLRAGFSPRKARHSLYLMGGILRRSGGQATTRAALATWQALHGCELPLHQ